MGSIKDASTTIFVVLILLINDGLPMEAKKERRKDLELVKHKETVKTIKVDEGYIIDCVDIYKQPAFDHPLLKNHTIKDGVVKTKKTMMEINKHQEISQTWHKKGRCPEGTIPIRRTRNLVNIKKSSPFTNRHVRPDPSCTTKIAGMYSDLGIYRGAHGALNIWNPPCELLDFSLTEMMVYSYEEDDPFEAVEVGIHVNPSLYGDIFTHLFLYWTKDDYQSSGCYNLQCAGFIQTNSNIEIGGALTSTSIYNGPQFQINVDIAQEEATGDWYVYINSRELGYWPGALFINLEVNAQYTAWLGHVKDCNQVRNTTTEMGSGHLPDEGFTRAAFIKEMKIIEADGNYEDPETFYLSITHPQCYDLTINEGTILYGGPGRSGTCP